jgi:solute:Na+ symporter, SSS family
LLLAALLAATSIPSGINTLAAVITLDFHSRFAGQLNNAQLAKWGKIYSLIIGIAATLSAGIVSSLGTIFEVSQIILGVFAGPLLSCIILATAGVRMRSAFMITAMVCGWTMGVIVTYSGVHPLWVTPGSAIVTLLVGWLLGRISLNREVAAAGFRAVEKQPELLPE